MTTELQSNVLSARTIRKALPSCMVYALVQSVTFMVDTIVAGHFLGSDAVAAVALRKEERSTALDVSIPTDAQSVTFVSEQLQSFFTEHGAPAKVAYACALCMEEIAADYLEHRKAAGDSQKKAYMDIKAFRDPEKIELVLRNYDEPYNPLVFEREEESFAKIGVTMVQRISKDITYSYAYHLNVVSVTIEA